MATTTTSNDDLEFEVLERKSGIPPKGHLGASGGEMKALLISLAIVLVIGLAFWFEATH